MVNTYKSRIVFPIIIVTVFVVNLIMLPTISNDPTNIPKLSALVFGSFSVVALLMYRVTDVLSNINKIFLVIMIAFLIQMTLSLFFSPGVFSQQFYGTYGRGTGYLYYICLVIIALSSSLVSTLRNLEIVVFTIISLSVFHLFYGTLQATNNDPINWLNNYNPIITFLGNPNFASSFLAICSISTFTVMVGRDNTKTVNLFLGLILIWSIALIEQSNSQQGMIVLIAGVGLVGFIKLFFSNLKYRRFILGTYGISYFLSATLGILGSLNHGPLSGIIYKASVTQRGYYWDAALGMISKFPIFGVGFDSYGDYYAEYRSVEAATLTGDVQSNSAHNVYLDLGVSGGLPLLFIYITFNLFVVIAIINRIRRQNCFDWMFIAIVGSWFGYQLQSLISINQIGLGIWGWLLGGLIIGYEFNSRSFAQKNLKKKNTAGKVLLPLIIGMAFGGWLSTKIIIADISYRTAVISGDVKKLIAATEATPKDLSRDLNTARILDFNNFQKEAALILDKALLENPRFYNAWKLKLEMSKKDSAEWQKARLVLDKLEGKNRN